MSSPALTPDLALAYLGELSTDVRAAVLLDDRGRLAAAHPHGEAPPADALGELALELLARADEAAGEAVAEVEATTAAGAVFCVRGEGWTIAVVAERLALSSLMRYDLRHVLEDLTRSDR